MDIIGGPPSKDAIRCDRCMIWVDSEYEAYKHLEAHHPIEFALAKSIIEENRPKTFAVGSPKRK